MIPSQTNIYKIYEQNALISPVHYQQKHQLTGELFVYLNYGGATNSVKDALATNMIDLAISQGQLAPSQPIVEASGSTFAVALTIAATMRKHPVYLVVPGNTSFERKTLLKNLGATVISTRSGDGYFETAKLAQELAKKENAYFINYFSNDNNPEYHRKHTGPALFKELKGKIDTVIAGVGSGGTLTGTAEYLKAWLGNVWVVAVQPLENTVLTGGFPGIHGIHGIGMNFIPDNYNPYIVDEVVAVPTGEAQTAATEILQTDGIPACISAGATLCAARTIMQKRPGRTVCIFNGQTSFE